MTDWQPIETCPERTYVDVWAVLPGVHPCRWPASFWTPELSPPGIRAVPVEGRYWQGVAFGWRPTHWTPVPQGPKGELNDHS